MSWLVGLSVIETSDRMANFLNYLDDTRQETGQSPLRIKQNPTAFANTIIVAPTAEEAREIIEIWKGWFKNYYPHIQLCEPMVTKQSDCQEHDTASGHRGVLIMEDSAYADRIVAHGGRAPRDIGADCVLALIDALGKRKHVIFYPFGRSSFRQSFLAVCEGAREVVVRWVNPDIQRLFPDLSPLAAR